MLWRRELCQEDSKTEAVPIGLEPITSDSQGCGFSSKYRISHHSRPLNPKRVPQESTPNALLGAAGDAGDQRDAHTRNSRQALEQTWSLLLRNSGRTIPTLGLPFTTLPRYPPNSTGVKWQPSRPNFAQPTAPSRSETLRFPERSAVPSAATPHPQPLPAAGTTDLLSVSARPPIPASTFTESQGSDTVGPLASAAFAWHHVLKVHPCRRLCQAFIPYF